MKKTLRAGLFFVVFASSVSTLDSKTIAVPKDYPTIKTAVAASRNGDEVVVDDGIYFEKNVIVDKEIRVVSRNLYGATIYGSLAPLDGIFIIRAKAEIRGFVLQNSHWGILQRNSPDVEWRARDLIILNMAVSAVEINDERGNVGSAGLENLVIADCSAGIQTNDAGNIRAAGCILIGCLAGFQGSDHRSFAVDKTMLIDCDRDFRESFIPVPGGATNRISSGGDVYSTKRRPGLTAGADIRRLASSMCRLEFSRYADRGLAERRWHCLLDKISGDWRHGRKEDLQAIEDWTAALKKSRALGFTALSWKLAYDLGLAYARQGEDQKSLGYIREAAAEIVSLAKELPLGSFQENFVEDKTAVFEDLIDRLAAGALRDSGQEGAREAFLASERFKSLGGALPLLHHRRAFKNGDLPRIDDGRIRAVSREISRLQRLLNDEKSAVEARRTALESLDGAEDEYRARVLPRTIPGPNAAPSVDSAIWRFYESGGRSPGPDRVIIEYFAGLKNTYAFLLAGDSVKIVKLAATSRFEAMVPNFLEYLQFDGGGEFAGGVGGRILYEALLAPLDLPAMKNVTRLTIIPDGVLNSLPFEALVMPAFSDPGEDPRPGTRKTPARDPFMIERYEIDYAPSLTELLYLEKIPRKEYPADLLAIANPRPKHPLLGYGTISNLRFATEEADRIAARFGRSRAEVVRGVDATEKHLKTRDLARYKIVHFAAHGVLDLSRWWRSALLLDRGEGPEEDGLLQPSDILGLDFDAELVVLSSCQSGNIRLDRGRIAVGLYREFFGAGARAVLSSLWEIDDRSTIRLMEAFYSGLLRGETPASALRSAKLELLRSKNSQPRFWAAFVMTGACSAPLFPAPKTR